MIKQVTMLTGQVPPLENLCLPTDIKTIFGRGGLGYSQFNEFLLALGYDRVTRGFFNYFFCQEEKIKSIHNLDNDTPFRIESFDVFKKNVNSFRKLAMLKYGNFKFAFKYLSEMEYKQIYNELVDYKADYEDLKYRNRPIPLIELAVIDKKDTYLLGYISGDRVKELKIKKDRGESITDDDQTLIYNYDNTIKKANENYIKYLIDDYMDVYIATSMRNKEDFFSVYEFIDEVFKHDAVKYLNLRYFDPTQADPNDRLAKGLLEGLMVKRAKCTIYCAQESDTFGKDSELAATLAQGKPVIVYIPKIDNLAEYKKKLRITIEECKDHEDENDYLDKILKARHPQCVLKDENSCILGKSFEEKINMLVDRDKSLYDSRAKTLHDIHPLSFQVNLETGVANGVLVVRNSNQCAELLQKIILKQLEFEIEPYHESKQNEKSYLLRETITNSIYRVVAGDKLLTNTFWNFYLKK